MKKLMVLVVIAAISLTSWRIVQSQDVAGSADENQIIVAQYEWDGAQQILLADLEAAVAALPEHVQTKYETRESQAKYLDTIIDEKLKLLLAIENELEKDEELLRHVEQYKDQLIVERLAEIEVDEKISYTDEDVKKYYETHKETYVESARSKATCITLVDEDLAQKVLEKIKGGTDILEMAQELSDQEELTGPGSNPDYPGSTFYFSQTAAPSWHEFVDEVFQMDIGEMTEAVFELEVNDQTYYQIIRKEDYKPERQRPLDEVKESVEQEMLRAMRRQRLDEWVEEVRKSSKLKYYLDKVPDSPPGEEESEE